MFGHGSTEAGLMEQKLGRSLLVMTVSGKNRSQGTKISRWGIAALPLSVFVGIVLGAVVGAAVAHVGIGIAVGAGFGVGVGVAVTVAVFLFGSSEPPGSQR